jgi:hypothetical protein
MGDFLDLCLILGIVSVTFDISWIASSLHSIAKSLKSPVLQEQVIKAAIKGIK